MCKLFSFPKVHTSYYYICLLILANYVLINQNLILMLTYFDLDVNSCGTFFLDAVNYSDACNS